MNFVFLKNNFTTEITKVCAFKTTPFTELKKARFVINPYGATHF